MPELPEGDAVSTHGVGRVASADAVVLVLSNDGLKVNPHVFSSSTPYIRLHLLFEFGETQCIGILKGPSSKTRCGLAFLLMSEIRCASCGEVSEWLKEYAWKAYVLVTVP